MDNFLIAVGPRKTATTWLYDYFHATKQLNVPSSVKETFYFDRYYRKGSNWYAKLFSNSDKCKCEFGPGYFTNSVVISRIKEDFPNAKIVITLRDPVSRLVSDYLHHLRYGHTKSRILDAIEEDNDLVESSLYRKHIQEWRKVFGEDSVAILYYEDMIKNPSGFVKSILRISGEPEVYYEGVVQGQSNVGGSVGNPYIAKIITKSTFLLKYMGLQSVINFGKTVGLKKIFYESKKVEKEDLISMEELNKLKELLVDENEAYSKRNY